VPFSAFGTDDNVNWFRASVGASTLGDMQKLTPRIKAALQKLQ
jgi:aspartate aminotransferase